MIARSADPAALEAAMPFLVALRRAVPDLDLHELAVPSPGLLRDGRRLAGEVQADVAFYRSDAAGTPPGRQSVCTIRTAKRLDGRELAALARLETDAAAERIVIVLYQPETAHPEASA